MCVCSALNIPGAPLTVGAIDCAFVSISRPPHRGPGGLCHDEPAVALCAGGGVAFLMPPFEKSDLFKGIVMGGVLPRRPSALGARAGKALAQQVRESILLVRR